MHYRHAHIVILWVIMTLCGLQAPAQDALNYERADSVSYQLYLAENWKALKPYGDSVIRQGQDGYYLRVRTGLACYHLGQHRAAIPHLKKALLFLPGDEFAMNYLYLAYLYCGRFEDARLLSRRFSAAQAELMKTSSLPAIHFISAEGGVKRSDSTARFKDLLFTSISLGHSIARKVSLFHSFTYFTQAEQRFEVQQFQYYLRGTLPLKQDFLLSFGAHVIYDLLYAEMSYTLPGNPPPPPQPGQPPPPRPPDRLIRDDTNTTSQAGVASINLSRNTRLLAYSLGFTAAQLDTADQYQVQGGLSLYPFKNNRLTIGSMFYQHTENSFKTNELAVVPFVSAYVSPKLFLNFSYLNNRGNNIIENTGYGINNSIDYTLDRYAFSASYRVFKNIWAYGTYAYENKKHADELFRYHYQVLLLGVKIIP
jgi:hypothetical protein